MDLLLPPPLPRPGLRMTRRRIIAGVILLAAVAVAVPLVPGVWLKVAYRADDVQEVILNTGPGTRTTRDGSKLTVINASVAEASRPALVKKWSWLPGRTVVLRDWRCGLCLRDKHDECLGVILIVAEADEVSCTCTDPSHDGEH